MSSKISSVRKAHDLYLNGHYRQAIKAYSELQLFLGENIFRANIEICEKRLSSIYNLENKNSSMMNVAFIADNNYFLPTYVAIYSLIRNKNDKLKIDIYILSAGLSVDNVILLKKLQINDVAVKIIDIYEDNSRFVINKKDFHVSTAAILKFNLPTILKELDRVLYLDGDIIVRSDLSILYNESLDGIYAAVVKDIKPTIKYKPSILDKLSIKSHRHYFNSGMMLLNLEAMRRDDVSTKLFQYREFGINFFMDQDAFNVVLGDNVKYISFKFNFLYTLLDEFSFQDICKEYEVSFEVKSIVDLINSAYIVHFASKEKPWKRFDEGKFHLWRKYYIASGAATSESFVIPENIKSLSLGNLIVSLTTYPARIETVHQTINSLLSQTFSPSAIILWLAKEEFPEGEKNLPNNLLKLKSKGLSIKWCHNIKSYKKLIPALKAYRNNIIVTADDDIIYKSSWLEQLVASYIQYPNCIHCSRAHKVRFDETGMLMSYREWPREIKNSNPSFKTFFTGCGGVLYPPNSLHNDVTNENDFMELCGSGDDIWFWGMAVLKGSKIRVVPEIDFSLDFIEDSQEISLWKINDTGGQNDIMLRNLFSRNPDILQKLTNE
jgi:lipopolysaccharide biosynthesis glycosyltransferase